MLGVCRHRPELMTKVVVYWLVGTVWSGAVVPLLV